VAARLTGQAIDTDRRLDVLRGEEADLVERMAGERSAAAAARVFRDDALIARVARAEQHLGRELERALAMLARLRAGRGDRAPDELGSFCG
jgi:hypothetical protein